MNTIIPANDLGISKYGSDNDFASVASITGFLPRLQLFGSNSGPVKKGQIPMAHYGLVSVKDKPEDLGPDLDILPVSWRPKALKVSEAGTAPVSYFNPKSEDFLKVQKDSEIQNSGCMFGPEFLVWIPSISRFASFFMASKTARRQAPDLRALMGRGATLSAQLIETKQYSWHGPTVKPAIGEITNLPDKDELKRQLDLFNNPEDSTIEFDPEKIEADGATENGESVRVR